MTSLEDLFVSGQTPHVENFNFIRTTLIDFNKELPELNERIKKFLVLIRLHIKKLKTKSAFVYGIFTTQWEPKIIEEEITAERRRFDSEGTHPMGDF
jgi:hypothetical protein